ncbi:SDR family NAD(P)-dependent oxidoreductase [Conexibacter sp. DBS9H8]|uniref:SDR family NAD(P)-dependent oxidoreductase n=1 Tax=Conexibacter sp. DBS9H8 TaxID=2937801 RepID=UPI00200F004D|nr:SDR family NAD(P)-dependent oxidoreductase [Conexibacter sp. DBS9H8]
MASRMRPLIGAGARAALSFSARIPAAGELVAPTLEQAVGGKLVLITGSSSGIGRASAHRVAAAGGRVILVARTRETLDQVVAEIAAAGGTAAAYPCDLTDLEAIDGLVAAVSADHGVPDILINNAGRSIRRSVARSYERFHDYERTMALNYFGAVRLTLGVLPGMRARRSGHIINISTMGLQTNTPRFSAYLASKAALDAFARSIAPEIVLDRVDITTVYMPLVRTPMIAPTKHYERLPALSPDAAADLVCEAIRKRPKRVSTPLGTLSNAAYAAVPAVQDILFSQIGHYVA